MSIFIFALMITVSKSKEKPLKLAVFILMNKNSYFFIQGGKTLKGQSCYDVTEIMMEAVLLCTNMMWKKMWLEKW